ncbi:MAG TPA: FixH family protein [Pseudomonadales bacterium]|nr:FixH family protein [Pseudomonadales bacterium]HNC69721.1 FixH family protein [Pseudomonadales bacterium]HND13871.1 FixH family protein [Pseudomonadales bacterium]
MTTPLPWYRQGWPWLLVLLPASTVIASLATVWLAFTNDDALVRDDYYREGLAINRRLDDGARARAAGLAAELRYEAATRVVELRLRGADDDLQQIVLAIEHPTDATRDEALTLLAAGNGVFRATASTPLEGKRYLLLEHTAADGRSWQLRGTLQATAEAVRVAHLDAD